MPNRKEIFNQPIEVKTKREVTVDLSGLSSLPYRPALVGGMQLPFSTGASAGGGNQSIGTNAVGGFDNVWMAVFGGSTPNNLPVSNSQAFPTLGGQIKIEYYQWQNYFTSFPCDIIVQGIEFCVTAGSYFAFNGTAFGCVALATASPTTTGYPTFTINQASQTSAEFPFVKSDYEGAGVTYAGSKTGLSIHIPAGTLFGIVCGVYVTDGSLNLSNVTGLNFSGSILYTIPAG